MSIGKNILKQGFKVPDRYRKSTTLKLIILDTLNRAQKEAVFDFQSWRSKDFIEEEISTKNITSYLKQLEKLKIIEIDKTLGSRTIAGQRGWYCKLTNYGKTVLETTKTPDQLYLILSTSKRLI